MKQTFLALILLLIFALLPIQVEAICSTAPCFYIESYSGTGMTSDPVTMEEGDTKAFILYLNNDRGVVSDENKISAFQVELSIPSNLKLMVDSSTYDYFPYDHSTKYSRFRRSLLETRYQEWLGVGTTMNLDLLTTSICYNISSRVDFHTGMNASYLSAPQGFQISGTTYVIHACGMPVSDYSIENYGSSRVFVGRLLLKAVTAGSANLTFTNYTFANSQLSASTSTHIALGSNGEQLISIGAAAPTSTPTPTPTDGPTPTPTPTGTTPTSTPTPTNSPTPLPSNTPSPTPSGPTPTPTLITSSSSSTSSGEYDLSLSDLNLVKITPLPTSEPRPTTELEVVEPDNIVPPPGEITPRPPATPFPTPNPNAGATTDGSSTTEDGEVLAVQSIRDLLIPGKSQADKTVVLFNFISILTLLVIIAVVIWRLLMMRKSLKLKQQHIAEIISGELATLETKLNVLDEKGGKEQFKDEFGAVVDMIAKEVIEGDNKTQSKGEK